VSLSSSGFDLTTLFEIVFTTNGPVAGTIAHDDGASIFDGTDSIAFLNSAFPTAEIVDNFSLPSAGTYDVWYVEANSAPSVLAISPDVTSDSQVPEPATLGILGLALLSLFGIGGRRRIPD
jgi:hypothetical protein